MTSAGETNPDGAVMLSVLLLVVSIGVLALFHDRWLGGRP